MITSLKNHFLVAMPAVMDPQFFHSVTYLCEHSEKGALGIIINQPVLNIRLGTVLEQIHLQTEYSEIAARKVFLGGPHHPERGFVLHTAEKTWKSTLLVGDNMALTSSSDILEDIARNHGPAQALVALGYVNWDPGQLEKEMADNMWLYGPANLDVIFHVPVERRWRVAVALMGIDIDKLSSDIGHA